MAKKEEWNDITALTVDMAIPANNISAANVGGTDYTVVDVRAREGVVDNRWRIDEISSAIQGGVHYIGKTTTALSDGATTNPIAIITDPTTTPVTTKSVTAVQGDMVSMANPDGKGQDIEFIFNGEKWYEIGSTGSLKAFAFVDTGKVTVTPKGSVTLTAAAAQDATVTASFSGTAATLTSGVTVNSYTPEGTISCGAYTPAGDVSVANIEVGDKKITVSEVSSATLSCAEISVAATFSGTAFAVPSAFVGTPATLTATTSEGKGDVTSNGTLDKLPALTATGSVNALTAVGSSSAIAGSASVTNGVLSFNFNTVLTSVNTTTADVAVTVTPSYTDTLTAVTDIAVSAKANMLTSVTVNNIEYTPVGTFETENVTPEGSVSTTKFTPNGNISVGKENVEKTVSIGTLSTTATFSGSAASLKADFAGTAKAPTAQNVSISYTPGGSVTGTAAVTATTIAGTFTGTEETLTVSPATT